MTHFISQPSIFFSTAIRQKSHEFAENFPSTLHLVHQKKREADDMVIDSTYCRIFVLSEYGDKFQLYDDGG